MSSAGCQPLRVQVGEGIIGFDGRNQGIGVRVDGVRCGGWARMLPLDVAVVPRR